MRAGRGVLTLAGVALMALSACGGGERDPQLMNLRSSTAGPDEFAILPSKPLELPDDLVALPDPTPGGGNLTDPNPEADASVALGGNPGGAGGIPAADSGLARHAARNGISADIRTTLAAEDLEVRRRNNGRILERVFNTNVYYKAYADQSLDQHSELARWRRAGARTPSAPPPKDGE
ncbi:MAG: DUF3035 domain-containing protein [Paracoccaceae bacterium]